MSLVSPIVKAKDDDGNEKGNYHLLSPYREGKDGESRQLGPYIHMCLLELNFFQKIILRVESQNEKAGLV
jgi:hypothetical protein